jgi:hypothetical protein
MDLGDQACCLRLLRCQDRVEQRQVQCAVQPE